MNRMWTRWTGAALGLLIAAMLPLTGTAQTDPSEPGTDDGAEAGFDTEPMAAEDDPFAEPVPPPVEPDPVVTRDQRRSSGNVDYDLRLRELEDRVNELKEDIFRSKSRLMMLREQILQTNIGGSRLVITHVDDTSATFDIVQVVYGLDGNQIFAASEGGDRVGRREIVYDEAILDGPHNLTVQVTLRGNGFGVFSYMEGYETVVENSLQFQVDEGTTWEIDSVIFEEGGQSRPPEERGTVRFDTETYQTTEENVASGDEDDE